MPSFALILLFSLNPLGLFPDSVSVCVTNSISNASITSIHYLVAGERRIYACRLDGDLAPGHSRTIVLPFRYMTRIVFGTDRNENYRETNLSLNPSSDTVVVSRSDREFGGFFDVIIGSKPYRIDNTTPVPMTGVFMQNGDSLSENLLSANPLLSDESLFLWLNSDTVLVSFQDIESNMSKQYQYVRNDMDSIFTLGVAGFFDEDFLNSTGLRIANCINGEVIVGIDVVSVSGESTFWDLSDSPLELWQGVAIPFHGEMSYIVCIDSSGREFTIDTIDEESGVFIADWMSVDFDFSFPSGSNR